MTRNRCTSFSFFFLYSFSLSFSLFSFSHGVAIVGFFFCAALRFAATKRGGAVTRTRRLVSKYPTLRFFFVALGIKTFFFFLRDALRPPDNGCFVFFPLLLKSVRPE